MRPLPKSQFERIKDLIYTDGDPAKDSKTLIADWQLAPHDTIIMIGMGLGALPKNAVKLNRRRPRIVILEPLEDIFIAARRYGDIESLLANDRVDIYTGDKFSLAQIVERYKNIIPIGRNKLIVHPNYDKLLGHKIFDIQQELMERIRALRDNWFTSKTDGKRMFKNTVSNLSSLFFGTAMTALRDRFSGIPAICVAAGPSLDEALPCLKRIATKVLLVACDSAVSALLAEGMVPDVVVTTDIFETNLHKLKPYVGLLHDTVFIFSIESNPDNIRLYLSSRRTAVSAYSKLLHFFLEPELDLKCGFPPMNSVSHMAIFSAMAVGASSIVMVGIDLAYTKGKSHAFESAFFRTVVPDGGATTYGTKGYPVPSTPQFVADKLLLERSFAARRGRYINTSIDGAYVNGTEIKTIEEVVAEVENRSRADVAGILTQIDWKPAAEAARATTIIQNLILRLKNFQRKCHLEKEKIIAGINRPEENYSLQNHLLKSQNLESAFENFEKMHITLAMMIEEVMLRELQELYRQREIILVEPNSNDKESSLGEMKILAALYGIYEKGAAFQIGQLKRFERFGRSLTAKICDSSKFRDSWQAHLETARFFSESKELWQAKREYGRCIEIRPENRAPYLELAQSLLRADLLQPARQILEKAYTVFGDIPELSHLQKEIQQEVDALFEKLKQTWIQGDLEATRKLLNQYLTVAPEDAQALELKRVIRSLDEEFSSSSNSEEEGADDVRKMPERFEQVAGLLESGHLEKSIGLLEGIIKDFPENTGLLREQIGDIRNLQKDYPSALWNYSEAIRVSPENTKIKNKICKIKSFAK